jgi:hypothetical protein
MEVIQLAVSIKSTELREDGGRTGERRDVLDNVAVCLWPGVQGGEVVTSLLVAWCSGWRGSNISACGLVFRVKR